MIAPHLIQTIEAHKDHIKKRFSVESQPIFGSASRGTVKADSDIDILVRLTITPGLFGFIDLKHYLEVIFGRSVDLVTKNAFKKQLREEVINTAKE